ncbi:hypothetical protein, partial [Roseovarius sp. D22-M7]|uniref:hypothetical protein n=1 Tax=Roseovarius sp. D22-M7 TaxID=3127116 RepID=UPI0030104D3F
RPSEKPDRRTPPLELPDVKLKSPWGPAGAYAPLREDGFEVIRDSCKPQMEIPPDTFLILDICPAAYRRRAR